MDSEPPLSSFCSFFFLTPFLLADPSAFIPASVLLLFLLLSSALISGSEVAFFSLDKNTLKALEEDDYKSSKRILKLIKKPQFLLSTILVANNLINIAIVVVSNYLIKNIFPSAVFEQWGTALTELPLMGWLSVSYAALFVQLFLTVFLVTFLLVLFGEVAPKIYANWNNIKFARLMAGPLVLIRRLLWPVSMPLVKWGSLISTLVHKKNTFSSAASKEDIDKAIDLTMTEGVNTEEEVDILKGINHFSRIPVKQIMRNRTDIFALDLEDSFDDVMEQIKEEGHSRIPVYEESIDNIKGILYIKDLIGIMHRGHDNDWHSFVRDQVMYVPEAKLINELLKEFQEEKMHMAIVVDEYGGTAGLVTMEDILEEVIGDIKDEFDDEEELDYIKLDDHNYVFEGKTLINDMCRVVDRDASLFDTIRGDADSLAGVLLEILGQIPRLNQEIRYKNFKFKILAVNKRRIQQIKVTLTE